ncbi:MAG: sirohydrochlorin cobaltochelatase [Mailhella sp.]|nr:sirohydrochlorin cobaltochelatase [Mailhella sp.]
MKKGILLVAYGSASHCGTRAFRMAQEAAEDRFHLPVRWAYTSERMRLRLARSRTKSDSVLKALNRMRFVHFPHVAVQPLHLIPGCEYTAVREDCRASAIENPGFTISLGRPLLCSSTGVDAVSEAAALIPAHMPEGRAPGEHVVLMAHGSRHSADTLYADLALAVSRLDPRIHIGSMIAPSELHDGADALSAAPLDGFLRLEEELAASVPPPGPIWLMPLFSVVGRHTLQDMAGPEPDSWKSRLESLGYVCRPDLRGLVDDTNFIALWMKRLEEALVSLTEASALPPVNDYD